MNRLNKQELVIITGGFSLTGTIINAFVTAGKFIYEAGKSWGGSLGRISEKKLCTIR